MKNNDNNGLTDEQKAQLQENFKELGEAVSAFVKTAVEGAANFLGELSEALRELEKKEEDDR